MLFLRYNVPPGHPKFGKIFRCEGDVHQPDYLRRLAELSGLTIDDMSSTLDKIKDVPGNKKMMEMAYNLKANPNPSGWYWLWGGPGNAKSEMLIALVNEFNRSNRGPAVYTKMTTIIDYMRQAFRDGADQTSYRQRFDRLRAIRVLAIDEMDKARDTPFVDEFRFDFLDERYRSAINGQTLTLFASNLNPVELPETIADRARDGRFQIIHNEAKSSRPEMK
jgi:DNA replication protein DnaC